MPDPADLHDLRERVRATPNLALSYLDLGKALEADGRSRAALRSYQRAVELQPNYAEAQFRLGRQWWALGNFEAARSSLERAARLRVPEVALPLHFNRDLTYGHHGMRDPWLLWDSSIYRLYYLAGRWDEPSRSIHAAHSKDLKTWHYDGQILTAPNDRVSFGNGTTRILNGKFYMHYARCERTDAGERRSIALATSPDGETWQTVRDREIDPDRQYYSPDSQGAPTSFLNPPNRKTYMFFGTHGAEFHDETYRACVGVAVRERLEDDWVSLPPAMLQGVRTPGASAFGQIDRPQVFFANDRYYLLFSCPSDRLHPDWRSRQMPRRLSESSMFCYVSDSVTGPYEPFPIDEPFIWGSERTCLTRSAVFFDAPTRQIVVYGGYPQSQLLEVSRRFPLGWDGDKLGIVFESGGAETEGRPQPKSS